MNDLAVLLEEHRRDRVELLADALVAILQPTSTGYQEGGRVPVEDLRVSCRDNIDRVLQLLRLAVLGDPADPERYDAARATGQRRAEQGMPLDDVLRSFRLGGRLIWDDLMAAAEGRLDLALLRQLGTHLWQVVDETSAQVAAAYHATERSRVREDAELRAQLWEGLLAGRGADPGFVRDATRILGLPDTDHLVVVAVEGESGGPSVLPGGADRWIRRSPGAVGVVNLPEADPDRLVARLARETTAPVGVSSVLPGLASVERGFREALLALRTLAGSPGVASFGVLLPEVMLLSAPDVATQLVDRWLGPVLALPEAESRALLGTLEAWVATGGSATRTATTVHCHRNTVLNRVQRVSELFGVALDGAAPPLELALALRALRVAPEG